MHPPDESDEAGGDYVYIYRPWYRHRHTGRVIHAGPGKVFRFRVRARRNPH